MSIIFQTDKLNIVDFERRHLNDKYVGWLNDPNVNEYSELRHSQHSLETCQKYWESFSSSPHHFWAIEETQNELNNHVGNLSIYVDNINSIADISIMIGDKSVWGNGYGSEAFNGAIEYLTKSLKYRKVRAGTMSVNIPMRRLMSKVGMKDDGIWKSHFVYKGVPVDVVFGAFFGE